MPKIKNKVTGKTETVTDEQLKVIQSNAMTKGLYDYVATVEPEEVKKLKEKATDAKAGQSDNQSS